MTENSTEKISEVQNGDVVFQNLFPALLQSFAVILMGYIAGRFEFIPESQCDGLARYVGNFALPALLFQKMASLSFGSVDWLFWFSILFAKGFTFILVFGVTLLIGGGQSLGQAAIFAMFASQSNDFALGYPLFAAMYKDSYPGLADYLYLFGPISLVCLNPLGFLALEIEKNDRTAGSSKLVIIFNIFKGLVTNPLVLSVAVGVAVNLITQQTIPDIVAPIVRVLSDSFSATALFVLGISLVGKMQRMSGFSLMTPLFLISAKLFLIPLSAILSVNLLKPGAASNITDVYSNFGFLYGMIPTTPSVFLYATQYDVSKDMVASSLFMCTVLSGPLMFVTAILAMLPSMERSDYASLLATVTFCVSCVGIISSVLLLLFFILRGCTKMLPHKFTVNLVVAQILACIGVVECFILDRSSFTHHICKYVLLLMGVIASQMWTSSLAVGLCLLRTWRSTLPQRLLWCFHLCCWGCPFCLIIILMIVEWPSAQDLSSFDSENVQVLISTIVLGVNILLTVSSLVIMWKYDRFRGSPNASLSADNTGPRSETPDIGLVNYSVNAIEQRPSEQNLHLGEGSGFQQESENLQDMAHVANQSHTVERCFDEHSHQLGRHLILLLFLIGSMSVSFVFNIWKQSSRYSYPGTFVQLDFIDKLLTFGQGFGTLLIFGLDREAVFLPGLFLLFRRCCQPPVQTSRSLAEIIDEDEVALRLPECRRNVAHDMEVPVSNTVQGENSDLLISEGDKT